MSNITREEISEYINQEFGLTKKDCSDIVNDLIEEIIDKRYHPNNWNIYTFYCGDGDNWSIDNEEALTCLKRLKEINQAMCYTEIGSEGRYRDYNLFAAGNPSSRLWDMILTVEDKNFKRIRLEKSKDIWVAFKKLFGGTD